MSEKIWCYRCERDMEMQPDGDQICPECGGHASDIETRSTFTMLYDHLVRTYGLDTAAIFGKVERFCKMDKKDPRCEAGLKRIADDLGLSRRTVRYRLKLLVKEGFLIEEVRPGKPTVYRDTRKAAWEASSDSTLAGDATPIKEEGDTLAGDATPLAGDATLPLQDVQPTLARDATKESLLRDSFNKQDKREQRTTAEFSQNDQLNDRFQDSLERYLKDTAGIYKNIGPTARNFWSQVVLMPLSNGKAVIQVPSEEAREYLEGRSGENIARHVLRGMLPETPSEIVFEVAEYSPAG